MAEMITEVQQITPKWLTQKLRRKGYLERGRVVAVRERESKGRFVTTSHYLDVSYSEDLARPLPGKMFVKIYKPELNQELVGRREALFYNFFPGIMPEISVVPCFAAGYDPVAGRAYVLMEDVSETHYSLVVEDRVCSREQLELLLGALAKFHAHWWDHPRLGQDVGEYGDRESFAGYIEDLQKRFVTFKNLPDYELQGEKVWVFERIFANWEKLFARQQTRKNLTIVHGDANPLGNVLYPKPGSGAQTYLIDWNYWQIDLAARDVAYAVVLSFYPNWRAKHERDVLRMYHDQLLEKGVKGYDWEDFWQDYRLSVVSNLLVPVIWSSWGISPEWWWPRFVKAFGAFEDLKCIELLG
ncbi:MAG: ecdysteroid 22-kinase family protein [Firmicutes bacterium]|nr:ecdysteroid 22-kinase family protein [Bacillota bacterium]